MNELGLEFIPDLEHKVVRQRCCDPNSEEDYVTKYYLNPSYDPGSALTVDDFKNGKYCGTVYARKEKKDDISCYGDDTINLPTVSSSLPCCVPFGDITPVYTSGSYTGPSISIDESEFQNPTRLDYCQQTYFKKKTRGECIESNGVSGTTEELLGSSENKVSCCDPTKWSSVYPYCVKQNEDSQIYCQTEGTQLFKKEQNECGDFRWTTPCDQTLTPCGENNHSDCVNEDTSRCVGGKYLGTMSYKNYTEYAPATDESKDCETRDCEPTCITDRDINYVAYSECDNQCGTGFKYKSVNILQSSHKPTNDVCRIATGDPNVYIEGDKLKMKAKCNEYKGCPPINCKVNWTGWSGCVKSCGEESEMRKGKISVYPEYGGTPCPPLSQTRSCNHERCPPDPPTLNIIGEPGPFHVKLRWEYGNDNGWEFYGASLMSFENGIHTVRYDRIHAPYRTIFRTDTSTKETQLGITEQTFENKIKETNRDYLWEKYMEWNTYKPNTMYEVMLSVSYISESVKSAIKKGLGLNDITINVTQSVRFTTKPNPFGNDVYSF